VDDVRLSTHLGSLAEGPLACQNASAMTECAVSQRRHERGYLNKKPGFADVCSRMARPLHGLARSERGNLVDGQTLSQFKIDASTLEASRARPPFRNSACLCASSRYLKRQDGRHPIRS
jgi:hypothetical protein